MLYCQAEKWSTRPSDLLHLTDWMVAFSIDQAVWNFGESLTAALYEAEDKGKNAREKKARRQQVLRTWLGDGSAAKQQYRDPGKDPEGLSRRL